MDLIKRLEKNKLPKGTNVIKAEQVLADSEIDVKRAHIRDIYEYDSNKKSHNIDEEGFSNSYVHYLENEILKPRSELEVISLFIKKYGKLQIIEQFFEEYGNMDLIKDVYKHLNSFVTKPSIEKSNISNFADNLKTSEIVNHLAHLLDCDIDDIQRKFINEMKDDFKNLRNNIDSFFNFDVEKEDKDIKEDIEMKELRERKF